jgi:glyoxylase-like metal-dependent hydrolase (beta-lactamase superfamily II)
VNIRVQAIRLCLLLAGLQLTACSTPPPPAEDAELGPVFTQERIDRGRGRLILEDPRLILRFAGGETFGGKSSRQTAMHMFSHDPEAIEDVRKKTEVQTIAPRSWLIRMPIVNVAAFETDAGLVVIDTGYGPAGPALLEALRSVSAAPVHTIIYTHGHVDHAYGTWALIAAGEQPQIIAHRNIEARFDRYIRQRGSLARFMSQPVDELPASRDDIVWPTRLFDDELELEIGGERLVLKHREGETDDQLYAWWPDRRIVVSADYYQGFLPNLGNGKRSQRYVDGWIQALREMSALGAQRLMPMHGPAITDPAKIAEDTTLLADALQHIRDEVVAGLNRGLSKDQIIQSLTWPERFADAALLQARYVTHQDIARMLLKQWTGWWDDVPSHWSPAPLAQQARAVVDLTGGLDAYLEKLGDLGDRDPRIALQLVDWAWYAYPDDVRVRKLVLQVYKQRVLDEQVPTQEALAYFDHMALVRALMMEAD